MSQKSGTPRMSSERIVKDIRRATRKQYSAEEKIRIVLDGLRAEIEEVPGGRQTAPCGRTAKDRLGST